MNDKIKLHLGCGKRYLNGYIHIDIDNLSHIDYCTKIDDLSMFQDNSVDEIYNCGVIGYYDKEETQNLLKECTVKKQVSWCINTFILMIKLILNQDLLPVLLIIYIGIFFINIKIYLVTIKD